MNGSLTALMLPKLGYLTLECVYMFGHIVVVLVLPKVSKGISNS